MRIARIVIVLLALIGIVAAGYFYADYTRFADAPVAPLPKAATFDVARGTPLPGIVRDLQGLGIRTGAPLYWRVLARQMDVGGKLHAGEYALDPGITPRGLLAKMAAGDVIQHKFTIVEGWTFAQLRDALAQDEMIERSLAGRTDSDIMKDLGSGGAPAEGWFLPQT